jgi:hypothetical protein
LNDRPGKFHWLHYTPTIIKEWFEDHVFPWMTMKTRIMVLKTESHFSNNEHIDCALNEVGTQQHKFRVVLKGNTDTLYFKTVNGNVSVPNIQEPFIMDGGWAHGMSNFTNDVKLTIAAGAPWRGLSQYHNINVLMKKSNYQMPNSLTNFIRKLQDFFKNMNLSDDVVKNALKTFYQFLPVISAVGVALSTFAGKSILASIPGFQAFAGALNPIMAGFLALIATSPELRTEVVKLLAAFKPLIPIVLQFGQTIANFLIKVLQIVIPLVRGFAESLQKFIPDALNFIRANETLSRVIVLVGKGLLLLMATMKIYATAGAMVAFVNKVILGGSFAKICRCIPRRCNLLQGGY